MKNLKVTIHLDPSSPVILNRFTTIDSILLSAYYGYMAKIGKRLDYDPYHKSVDFIEKRAGVFSGSIWYIDRTENIYYDFIRIVKKPEYRKIFDSINRRVATNHLFKASLVNDEVMITKKVHFYIRGSKEHVEALLKSEVKSIGKKQKLGFGVVSDIDVEEIDEDFGYMLNPSTPSKPLPVSDFTVKSKKIAFFRRVAPYWENSDLEACYMPTSSLYERVDKSDSKSFTVSKDLDYVSNVKFIYDFAKRVEGKDFKPYIFNVKVGRGGHFEYKKSEELNRCIISNTVSDEGVFGDVRTFLKKWKSNFSDLSYIKNGNFLSKEVLWCIDNLNKISYSYVSANGKSWHYLQGKNKKDGKTINELIKDHKKLKPPFSINLKDTANQQHISFKGRVSISNAFYYVQYGNSTLQIDAELLEEAIKDINRLTSEYKNITKTHLCGSFRDNFHVQLKSKSSEMEEFEVIEFHKKYNLDLRNFMSVIAF